MNAVNNGTRFFVSNASKVKLEKAVDFMTMFFPEELPHQWSDMQYDPKEGEEDHRKVVVKGQSTTGVEVWKYLNNDKYDFTVFLPCNASGVDVIIAFALLRSILNQCPKGTGVVSCGNEDGNYCGEQIFPNDETRDNEWAKRLDFMHGILFANSDKPVRLEGWRDSLTFVPNTYREMHKYLEDSEMLHDLYQDYIDAQGDDWYYEPEEPEDCNTFIMRWNPAISNYKIDEFMKDRERFHNSGRQLVMSWSIWDYDKVKEGDDVYLLMVGEGKTGIVASGTVIGEPYIAEDWSGQGREVHYVDFIVETIHDPNDSDLLTVEQLHEIIPEVDWNFGHSGTIIEDDDVIFRLDDAYIERHFSEE